MKVLILIGLILATYPVVIFTHWFCAGLYGFILPTNLWRLVPFRVTGWKSPYSGITYKIKWVWDELPINQPHRGEGGQHETEVLGI